MSALTDICARKLLQQRRCPACGSPLIDGRGGMGYAFSAFGCGAEFMVAKGQISVSSACPGASHVAAAALNKEVAEEAAMAGAA